MCRHLGEQTLSEVVTRDRRGHGRRVRCWSYRRCSAHLFKGGERTVARVTRRAPAAAGRRLAARSRRRSPAATRPSSAVAARRLPSPPINHSSLLA